MLRYWAQPYVSPRSNGIACGLCAYKAAVLVALLIGAALPLVSAATE